MRTSTRRRARRIVARNVRRPEQRLFRLEAGP
jgi:hypothetical protein